MSDEPRVIAKTESYRMLADGRVESRTIDGMDWQTSWVWDKQDFAALLADAFERVREEMKNAVAGTENRLSERVEAVDDSVDQDHVAMHELEIRVSYLERDPFVEHGKRQALEERVLEVERLYSLHLVEDSVSRRGLADRLAAVKRELNRRIDANSPVRAELDIGRLSDRVSALEARQQDETREGAAKEPSLWVDEFERRNGDRIRRELAREIVERLRNDDYTVRPYDTDNRIFHENTSMYQRFLVADWIAREYGGANDG